MRAKRATPRARLFIAGAAAIFLLGGCHDIPEPLAPGGDVVLSTGAPGTVDVIVVLNERLAPGGGAANRERAAEIASGLGLTASHAYGTALFGFAATVPSERVEALRRNPQVAHLELDRPVSLPEPVFEPWGRAMTGGDGAQTSSGAQVVPWGVDRTGAQDNVDGLTGSGIHVYVLDTGIDPEHPDLKANLGDGFTAFESTCRGNQKNCPPPQTWHDVHGHGTHVAGTIGAADNGSGVVGVAPEVTLHAVKVLSDTGSGSRSGIIAGIDWVASHNPDRARVANMSIGGGGGKFGTCTENGLVGSTDAYHAALCNAKNRGVVFTVSAGNSGADAADYAPASFYDAAITVSATSCRFDNTADVQTCEPGTESFTTWSNWGNRTDSTWPSKGSLPVAIAAPGANVLSTTRNGEYGYMSGTSMAAPHVAGGAALVLQQLASQAADGSVFTTVRAALLGATECTATWHNVSGNPHSERFLNLRSSDPIAECVAPGDPPPTAPTDLEVVEVTSTTVSLAWEHGNPDEARFEIWQNTGGNWGHLTYVERAAAFTAVGLSPATAYGYAVRAVAGGDTSPWSNIVNVMTLPDGESDAPAAAFSYDCGNSDTCRFINESTGQFLSWHWDLGNGQVYEGLSPPPTKYIEERSYTVTLQVEDVFGSTNEAEAEITCARRGNRLRCQ